MDTSKLNLRQFFWYQLNDANYFENGIDCCRLSNATLKSLFLSHMFTNQNILYLPVIVTSLNKFAVFNTLGRNNNLHLLRKNTTIDLFQLLSIIH